MYVLTKPLIASIIPYLLLSMMSCFVFAQDILPQQESKPSDTTTSLSAPIPVQDPSNEVHKAPRSTEQNQGSVSSEGLARSGDLIWNEQQTLQGLRHQQIWVHWEYHDPPPVESLEDTMVRRRAVIEAIERELLVNEAKKRKITITLEELKQWIYEQIPGENRPSQEGLEDLIRARLKLHANASLDTFWQAAERIALVEKLRVDLTAEITEEEAHQEWLKRGRLIGLQMLLVPRVPTSDEITQATRTFQKEMRAYYDEHHALFSQVDRALVTPIFFSGGKGEQERLQLLEVQRLLSEGQSLIDLKAQYPTLQTRAKQSLSSRLMPKKTILEEGSVSKPRITRFGWTIYQIHKVYRGYTRSFEERSVQRECAAAILIENNQLSQAMKVAQRGRSLLSIGDEVSVKSWAKANRAHLKIPAPFYANANQVIPMLGTAPALHDQLFSFQVGQVSEIIPIRQSYVIAKVISKQERTATWDSARVDFMRQWRVERSRKILNEWLTSHLEGQPRWVSSSRLKALNLQKLSTPLSMLLTHDSSTNPP